MTEIASGIPTPGGEPAAPAAPAEPAAPAPAPAAPVVPPEPAAPAPPVEPVKTPEQEEEDEWEAAEKEVFPGLRSRNKQTEKPNEPAKPEEEPKDPKPPQGNPEDKKPDAGEGASDDTSKQGDPAEKSGDKPSDSPGDDPARAARVAARQLTEQKQALVADVRSKMFADVPEFLADAENDPIRSIADVMSHINPDTGEAFTEEAAAAWLLNAQQDFNRRQAEINKQVDNIAEMNITVKDEGDYITSKYGEYLKAHPEERDAVWKEYIKTLTVDEKSGLILNAPVSLQWFYEQTIGPRVAAEQQSQAATEAAAKAQAEADAKAKAEARVQNKKNLADRSEIYAPPANPNADPEEAEWAEAEKAVFGKQIRK